jgi:hypothetical protein
MPDQLVEIGFDLVLPTGPFFTLDDATKGKLDNTTFKLAGFIYYDITNYVTGITLTRGKSNNIDNISSGDFVVELNNRERTFDPEYASSPFFGNILPKRVVRYSVNGVQQYQGVIDDWGLAYSPDGDAIANFVASDGFVYLNNQTLGAGTATAQLSGARITAILDDQFVQWPTLERTIAAGQATLGANVVTDGQNALSYLQQVELSELGLFFIGKDGKAIFRDRTFTPTTSSLTKFADDGTGIGYQNLIIAYGSEDLVNEVASTSVITNTETISTDTDSQNSFGIFNATFSDLLLSTNAQVETFNATLLKKYSEPVYRFNELEVRLNNLDVTNQNKVLNLELGDFVQVVFTPSGIPPAINKYAQVIRANHSVDLNGEHIVTLGLNTLNFTYFKFDDLIFGRLDFNSYFD